MEDQIRKLNTVRYENPTLVKRFTDNGNKADLNLSGQNLKDEDMEIVADQLKINKVRQHCFFLPFRPFLRYKSKASHRATSMTH